MSTLNLSERRKHAASQRKQWMDVVSQATTIGSNLETWLDRVQKQQLRAQEICNELTRANPDLPLVTAIIMAGDLERAEALTPLVLAREDLDIAEACWLFGSYARFEWAYKHLPIERILPILPELWRGSDPDDTDPRFLQLWRDAKRLNGNRIVMDAAKPPLPNTKFITVYRGQGVEKLGFSFSTDKNMATRFANGAGLRAPRKTGKLLITAEIPRKDVLGYLTQRGESEVIVDIDNKWEWKRVKAVRV